MKYAVFAIVAIGVIPLAALLTFNVRWMKYAFWGVVVAMCLYQQTAINFFSHELYPGTSRGMEVSLIHLFAIAILAAFALRRKFAGWMPETGYKLYVLYFLMCMPSLTAVGDGLIAWLEVWKMIMLFIFYVMVYTYLNGTGDVDTVLKSLAIFTIINTLFVVKAHYAGVYQPHGVFPHRNGMAMGMLLLGPIFFAAYVTHGLRSSFGKMCAIASGGAVLCTLWSYSRGAIAMLPLGYGIAALSCCVQGGRRWRKVGRLLPIVVAAALGVVAILPRVIERFVNAPKSSGETRVELAACAWEMIRDKPLCGVGINNWSIKMAPPYEYQDRASERLEREFNYRGIVETVYLLVCAECGIPALVAMLIWFGWYWLLCVRLLWRLKDSYWAFVPAGLLGGLSANYLQSALEWVLRQQLSLICLMFTFAILSYLNISWKKLVPAEGMAAK